MTGYESKRAAAQDKLKDDDLTIAYQSGYYDGKKAAQPAPMLLIQSHREEYWCADLTCKKCYGADFRFKHAPPQRPWVDLTDDDCKGMSAGDRVVAMLVSRILKEKNT